MDHARFDALSRLIGSGTSRRTAMAITGLLSVSVPDAAAGRCSAADPCPACRKCKRHRCKPVTNGTACQGGICQDGKCRCTDPTTHRCPGIGVCGECCAIGECPDDGICQSELGGPYRCYCNTTTKVECEQECIPKSCAGQCNKSCSGSGADCGCAGYLTCHEEQPGVFRCLPIV